MRKLSFFYALVFLFVIWILASCQKTSGVSPTVEMAAVKDPTVMGNVEKIAIQIPAAMTPELLRTATPEKKATPSPLPTHTSTPTLTATTYTIGPNFPLNINPLTGLEVSDPDILDRRPLMIKVSNFPAYGRPHSGLSFADIVFETYIGEGTNRFSAIFYGHNPEKDGPIRSARLSDPQLAGMYQSVLAFKGADARVYVKILQDLSYRAISEDPSTCPALCNLEPDSIIGVYAEPEKLTEYAESHGVYPARKPLNGMVFSSEPPTGNNGPADIITIKYNDLNVGEWRYDSAGGTYMRWIEEVSQENSVKMVPLVDKLTGQQLAFNNVLILFAHYNEYNPTLHNIELLSNRTGMRAVLFRDGLVFNGYWISPAVEEPMQFNFLDGTPMALKPGNSWMVITGSDSDLVTSDTGNWHMQFLLP